jgi:hypothetical protein
MSLSAILPPLKKKQSSTFTTGHFHFAHIGHYHFAPTGADFALTGADFALSPSGNDKETTVGAGR